MADGQLKCIGPIQNLKNSFGLGFVIHTVYNERDAASVSENIVRVKNSMKETFSQSKLQEEYAVSVIHHSLWPRACDVNLRFDFRRVA